MPDPNQTTTAIAPVETTARPLAHVGSFTDLLFDSKALAHAQRLGMMFARSMLVPKHMRANGSNPGANEEAIANCTLALLMAVSMGENPVTVMQNIVVVHGSPGWSAKYVYARAAKSGVFSGRITWREYIGGDADAPARYRAQPKTIELGRHTVANLVVEAIAVLADSGEEITYAVSMLDAQREGWTRNEKYFSLPHLMLRYRSSTLLVRLYAPEVMLGMRTDAEIIDAPEVYVVPEPLPAPSPAGDARAAAAHAIGMGPAPVPAPEPEPEPAPVKVSEPEPEPEAPEGPPGYSDQIAILAGIQGVRELKRTYRGIAGSSAKREWTREQTISAILAELHPEEHAERLAAAPQPEPAPVATAAPEAAPEPATGEDGPTFEPSETEDDSYTWGQLPDHLREIKLAKALERLQDQHRTSSTGHIAAAFAETSGRGTVELPRDRHELLAAFALWSAQQDHADSM